MSDRVDVEVSGPVATVRLVNPRRLNALTFRMYDALGDACERMRHTPEVRVVVLRGDGGRAFAAGTDITEFTEFTTAQEGVDYEHRTEALLNAVATLPMPVVAAVDGPAVGAGLALALSCDVVLATPDSVFGAPVARTLGNCLSVSVVARLYAGVGRSRARALLMTAGTIDGEQAHQLGLVHEVVARDGFDDRVAGLATQLAGLAPKTLAAFKTMDERLMRHLADAPVDDIYADCYGSTDFREGVEAFLAKRSPQWAGR